jgi:putative transposase
MKQSRITEERIIAILREHEAGSNTGDVCRKHGIKETPMLKPLTEGERAEGIDLTNRVSIEVHTAQHARLYNHRGPLR